MNASKENCRKARQKIDAVAESLDTAAPDKEKRDAIKRKLMMIDDFLEAAERKLPSEAAYEKDKKRKTAAAS